MALGFLLISGSAFAYVKVVGPGSFGLDEIQHETDGSSSIFNHVLIMEANQDIEITFSSGGNLKREELDKNGKGLGRYDELKTIIVKLKIYGSNAWEWNGKLINLDGVKTFKITPDCNGKIWMNISIKAKRDSPGCGKDNTWYESADAGLYLTWIGMSIIAVGQPPRPSLEFRPDDAESLSPSYCIQIHNTGDEEKDDAKNVEVAISVVKSSEYVSDVNYNPVIGNIENGEFANFCFAINTNSAWNSAPSDTEIKLEIKITREDNWPEHNVGKLAHYTLIK